MGLDGVELIMEIEERFEIEIDEDDAVTLATVEDMHEYIVQRLKSRQSLVDEAAVWDQLLQTIVDTLFCDLSELKPETRFIEDLKVG